MKNILFQTIVIAGCCIAFAQSGFIFGYYLASKDVMKVAPVPLYGEK